MRIAAIILTALAFMPPDASAQDREPTVAGRIVILKALRDARVACSAAGGAAWQRCVERESADGVTAAERTVGAALFAGPGEVGDTQSRVLGAMQAAYADCRGRGVPRGTARWEFCTIEQGITRLEEALGAVRPLLRR